MQRRHFQGAKGDEPESTPSALPQTAQPRTELTTEGKEESWNEMLSRFCEELIGTYSANKSQAAANWQEGDENIVDSLLDSFLQQKGLRSSSCEWNRAICYL